MDNTYSGIEQNIAGIINDYDPNLTIKSYTSAKAGYNNPVYIIETSSNQDLVLRVLNTDTGWKIRKETLVYSLLSQHGIPVAKILKTDDIKTLLPYSYTISEKIPGYSLSSQKPILSRETLTAIYEELGAILAKIHSITFDRFGDVTVEKENIIVGPAHELSCLNSGPFDEWKTMFLEIIQTRIKYLIGTEFEDVCADINEFFTKNIALIDYKITPRLLHLDLHGSNIFVENGHITGIIDVEESLIGHNEYDLMRTEVGNFDSDTTYLKDAFYDSYTRDIALDHGYEARRNFYQLSRTLVQAQCLVTLREKYSDNLIADIEDTKRELMLLIQDQK